MNRRCAFTVRGLSLAWALVALSAASSGQTTAAGATASIEGTVCDSQHNAIAGAVVILDDLARDKQVSGTTDRKGQFKFSGLPAGAYKLSARQRDFADKVEGPFSLKEHDTKSLTLLLNSSNRSTADVPFSDETHFTVAGITDTTSLGAHGSDPVRRNSDALTKEAAHLSSPDSATLDEAAIREQLSREENAGLRFQLAEIEEKSGRALAAVNDYQRAAQLEPTESHLFSWGTELLVHRAFDPAVEVFSKGRKLYPQSVRMALGLGVATYAKGSSEEANQIFLQACDIAPSDPGPYLFLGRAQLTETELPAGWTDRLKRFVELEPQNARAHYIYGVALTKKPSGPEQWALASAQLKTAVELDAHFGDAFLELGILATQQGDLPAAAAYLQKAVENTEFPEDAHYRLAQVYRRMGQSDKALQETEAYRQASEKKTQQVEQERRELQQFVYTLREQPSPKQDKIPQK